MLKHHASEKRFLSNHSEDLSYLAQSSDILQMLRQYSLRKSVFKPEKGLAESYAGRNHIAGAEVPVVEVVYSSNRWVLLQSPRFGLNVFKRLNSGEIAGNTYQVLLNILKSFKTLAEIYGYFRPNSKMIFLRRGRIYVWINEDIFSNEPQQPLGVGPRAERQFVLVFLEMLQRELQQWEQVSNVFTIQEVCRLLQWRSKLRRGSLTAVQASKEVFHQPNESKTSFQQNELSSYSKNIKGCKSVQEININPNLYDIQGDISSSVTIKEDQKLLLPRHIDENLLYDSKDMKNSIYDEIKTPDSVNEVRKTKKKFNLTSTSSTLQKFSQVLKLTSGNKKLKLEKVDKQLLAVKESKKHKEADSETHNYKAMHRSEPINIASQLEGLFEDDEHHRGELGMEGDRQQLEKIAEQMEEILIW